MRFGIRNVTVTLVILNIVFFVLQIIIKGFTQTFVLISSDVLTRPWILITSMFLHGSIAHLLFNMYVLFIFGPLLEQRIGQKRFLLVYFTAGIVAAFVSTFFYQSALGASAAIMGMLGVIIILLPNLRVLLMFIFPMPLWIAAIIFALIDIFGIFYPAGIANIAHLVGLGIGLLLGLYLKKQKVKFNKQFSTKKHLDQNDIDDYLKSGRI